ncbi:UDP-glycosyltransferase TURAN [Melia azedarach]|uniref:UDP-glycosyltransferase TURAN n=1 Tax=Melia azedarach TaxID=155640 RepID=A0ACC1Y848_MELAZ|nr:UDP-glycosyltransferase TURAN [Melia azedarach]
MANGSLCVTKAMQHELAQNWDIKADVLYDQPPEFFHPTTLEGKHKTTFSYSVVWTRVYGPLGVQDCVSNGMGSHKPDETLFITRAGNDVFLKPNRLALVLSSTSWTPDEDFGFFWKQQKRCLYPRLFIITGKGPDKEKYEEKIRRLHLKRVAFCIMWLSAEDYPLLLGSADLGCGLSACAVSYSCIEELVKVEKNGLLFSSSSELADQLLMLFKGFPDECDALKKLRNGMLEMVLSARWATEWEEHAKPLISEVISQCAN